MHLPTLLLFLLTFLFSGNLALGVVAPRSTVHTGTQLNLPDPDTTPASKRVHGRSRRVGASATVKTSKASETLGHTKFPYEEAKNLLIADQKYFLKYEDEDTFGRVGASSPSSRNTSFSKAEVEQYRDAVEKIAQYRNNTKNHCLGASNQYFVEALDKYLTSLSSFNRRAIPLVADISSNNNQLVLVVNRTTLTDAPVLISRYLQFKKQRFKETMDKFLPSDSELIAAMVRIGKTLDVSLNDEAWNRTYGIRDNGLELISLWPRETIFQATEKLADAKESVCVVTLNKPVQETPEETTPKAAE